MKVLIILLLLPLILPAKPVFKFFENQHPELPENKEITGVFQDPGNSKRLYYTAFDSLFLSEDGQITKQIDLSKEMEDQEVDETELNEALEALYEEIYEEEKEELETELGVDDAEEYYDDLIKERADDRFEEEGEILKEDFKYLQMGKDQEVDEIKPIGKVIFLQNSSSVVLAETANGFYLSTRRNPFKLIEQNEEKDYNNIILKDTDIPFVSNNKLYIFDAIEEEITPITLERYNDHTVVDLAGFFPYLLIRTTATIHLLKQEDRRFDSIRSIPFESEDQGKLYLFQGNDIYFLGKNSVNWFDLTDNRNVQIETPYSTLFDLYSKNKMIYLASNRGLIVINPITQTREILSLGLLPEEIDTISGGKALYVGNKQSIYKLRVISNLKELKSVKDILAIKARIVKKYPTLQELFTIGINYNFLSRASYSSMMSRSKYAHFLPKLYGKYRHTLQAKEQPKYQLTTSDNLISITQSASDGLDTTTTPYFEAYMLFDLSRWIFDNQELSTHNAKESAREARESLRNSITYYYNHYILLQVLYQLSDNNRDRLTFRLQAMESGAILNGLIGKQLFRGTL